MTPEEKNLISGLFDRLGPASNQPKDPEAEQLIHSKVAENPGAPYLLAQSTLVMQQALANAQNRISDLERQVASAQTQPAQKPGGFLSGVAGLFGGGQPSTPPPVPVQRPQSQPPPIPVPQQYTQPYQQPGYPPPQQPSGGGAGGFLSGALTTAAGVAGGALLFRGIEGLLGHNPGPFGGAAMPGGGFLNSGVPTENTEIVNNYYNDDGRRTSDDQQVDQGTDLDPDPDPDPVDYAADNSDPDPDLADDDSGFDGGSDDNSLV